MSEGVDYCFLYRKHIGGGQYGQVYRTWFYDLRGSYQGDIALKQVTFGLLMACGGNSFSSLRDNLTFLKEVVLSLQYLKFWLLFGH